MVTFIRNKGMALPPKVVYNAKLVNHSGVPVTVKVTYVPAEVLELAIPAGGSAEAPQKLVNMGTWQATANIVSVEVSGTEKTVKMVAPFPGVTAPVKDAVIVIEPHLLLSIGLPH